MKSKLTSITPVGYNYKLDIGIYVGILAVAIIRSTSFLFSYVAQYIDLFEIVNGKSILLPDAKMLPFEWVIDDSFSWFPQVIVISVIFIFAHYFYHYQKSKSIYLMKRLPQKHELLKRCIALPLIFILVTALTYFLLLVIYLLIYIYVTPKPCLETAQFGFLERMIIL